MKFQNLKKWNNKSRNEHLIVVLWLTCVSLNLCSRPDLQNLEAGFVQVWSSEDGHTDLGGALVQCLVSWLEGQLDAEKQEHTRGRPVATEVGAGGMCLHAKDSWGRAATPQAGETRKEPVSEPWGREDTPASDFPSWAATWCIPAVFNQQLLALCYCSVWRLTELPSLWEGFASAPRFLSITWWTSSPRHPPSFPFLPQVYALFCWDARLLHSPGRAKILSARTHMPLSQSPSV